MSEQENSLDLERAAFREVIKHPQAHAFILGRYRMGEYAGVIALKRLLNEIEPAARLGKAMERHYQDELRHTHVFTDWMRRLGVEPEPLSPEMVEGFFFASKEEFVQQRRLLEQMPVDLRRIMVFAGINAVERLAFNQFENHLLALDRKDDIEEMKRVMKEERFHLNYVESELEKQQNGPHGEFLTVALDLARQRFQQFQEARRAEVEAEIKRLLG